MDICLEHNGIEFEKTLYSDAGNDKGFVLNCRACPYGGAVRITQNLLQILPVTTDRNAGGFCI